MNLTINYLISTKYYDFTNASNINIWMTIRNVFHLFTKIWYNNISVFTAHILIFEL